MGSSPTDQLDLRLVTTPTVALVLRRPGNGAEVRTGAPTCGSCRLPTTAVALRQQGVLPYPIVAPYTDWPWRTAGAQAAPGMVGREARRVAERRPDPDGTASQPMVRRCRQLAPAGCGRGRGAGRAAWRPFDRAPSSRVVGDTRRWQHLDECCPFWPWLLSAV